MDAVRLRLLFEDHHILSKSQRKDGLRQSWIALKPQHKTISDFASYILHIFNLHQSCPNGLLLSMDGFVLPPFELTCVFKDKDIVSVRKKGGSLTETIEEGDDVNALEGQGIVGNQNVDTGVKLLANEGFNKETGGYESESEEDEDSPLDDAGWGEATPSNKVSKKRKASEKLSSSKKKKKKSKSVDAENTPAAPVVVEDDAKEDKNRSSRSGNAPSKKKKKRKDVQEDKSHEVQTDTGKSSSPVIEKRSDAISKSLPDSQRVCQLQGNGEDVNASETPDGAKKLPSRSARRKKAKRRWLREHAKIEKELQHKQSLVKDNQPLPLKDNTKVSEEHEQPVQNCEKHAKEDSDSEAEDNIVPIVIRPGHIRFEPYEKGEEQAVRGNQLSAETFQWNGINSKKKGQKWGREKSMSSKRYNHQSFDQACSEDVAVEEEMPVNNQMDLEKLASYSSLPKEGDIVAYRLIELSSSWTPEVSSFRVGKISQYVSASNRIVLAPVAEYPITTTQDNMDEEASEPQPNTSLYGEDGSLEIEYSSLLDVRLVKQGSNPTKSVARGGNETPVRDQNTITTKGPNNNTETTPSPAAPKENGGSNSWDEIAQVLSAKKAELSKEDGWNNSKNSNNKNPWSYRAFKGSALGPTISKLREQNKI